MQKEMQLNVHKTAWKQKHFAKAFQTKSASDAMMSTVGTF